MNGATDNTRVILDSQALARAAEALAKAAGVSWSTEENQARYTGLTVRAITAYLSSTSPES